MNEEHITLYKKMLEFWNEHDGVEFTTESLRSFFSSDEIATIMFNDEYKNVNYSVVSAFRSKVGYKREDLFLPHEADKYFSIYLYNFPYMKLCSKNFLLSLVNDENFCEDAIECLNDEQLLVEALKMVKDPYLKVRIVSCMKDDNLKAKHLNKVPMDRRSDVIVTFQDEYFVEKYISMFRGEKGYIIRSLNDDDKKIRYFKKYFAILTPDDKAQIICSLEDDEKVLHYLKYVGDYAKGEVVRRRFRKDSPIVEKIVATIRNKKVLAELFKYEGVDVKIVEKYIGSITNQQDLEDIIFSCGSEELVIQYFPKLSYRRRLERIRDIGEPNLTFKLLKHVNRFKDIISIIEHCDYFPEYSNDYEYIVDLYSNVYQVDKQRLLTMVKNISFSILKYMDNENIRKILNSNEDEFVLLMRMFNKQDLKMDQSSMNDILNTLLQRKFRISSIDIVLIFPLTLNAIDSKDRETVLFNIDKLAEIVHLDEEIKEYGWNRDTFVDALMNKDESAIDFLHLLTAKYIRVERSNFVQENIDEAMESCTDSYCDKNDYFRYVINNYPVELIMDSFFYSINDNSAEVFTQEEFLLSQNQELIKQIILYKKNPRSYDKMPDEVRMNLKAFNGLFEKRFHDVSYERCPGYKGKVNVDYKDIDEDFIINILMHIDVDKLRINLFKDSSLVDKLMKFWKQYKIGGWGNTFNSLLSSSGVVVDPEIVANFIQYFGLSFEQLEEKKNKNEISSISLTALLDMAACYSTESKKYSLLFGEEDFKLIAGNPGPNSSTWSKEKRIDRAVDLVSTIRKRKYVTVPPVDEDFDLPNGKKMNVVVGNFSNMMNLTYGERTGACMRIGGAGKSLFDFCLEDNNGFHIRFVNPRTGKFVSRVSGFRNGNTVFLNELRYSEDPEFTNRDVVETCKLVAKELVELSKDSELPIDNVVITPYYSMKESGMLASNLGISDPQKGMKQFYTDVSSTSIILATSDPDNKLVTPKLGVKGVPQYRVVRDKKQILYNREAAQYMAHILTLDKVLNGTSVDNVDVIIDENIVVCLAGEDWFVTIDKQGNISKYIMKNSNNLNEAINEVQAALAYLRENLNKEMQIANNVLGM